MTNNLENEQLTAHVAAAMNAKPPSKGALVGVVVVLVAVVAIIGLCGWGLVSFFSGAGTESPSQSGAKVMCEDRIKKDLKSPDSADFNGAKVTGSGNGPYVVRGSVDADNSFGAHLRTSYTCTATFVGDNTWETSYTTG